MENFGRAAFELPTFTEKGFEYHKRRLSHGIGSKGQRCPQVESCSDCEGYLPQHHFDKPNKLQRSYQPTALECSSKFEYYREISHLRTFVWLKNTTSNSLVQRHTRHILGQKVLRSASTKNSSARHVITWSSNGKPQTGFNTLDNFILPTDRGTTESRWRFLFSCVTTHVALLMS